MERLTAAPGNPGIATVADLREVRADDPAAVAALAVELAADLVVIGPEAPLVAGVADAVRAKGIACFGPSAAAARLEGSKAFAKDVMAAAGVPTGRSHACTTPEQAAAALDEFGAPYVVKNDGLAAGKGVVVTSDREVALEHARDCGRVVIEEFLDGPEVSLFVVTDGTAAVPLMPAQDFKRVADGDEGPNTGGMGAYAPLPWALSRPGRAGDGRDRDADARRDARAGHAVRRSALRGAGADRQGPPRVIEFNARFGDPETQVVLALLASPLGGLLHAAATGTLADLPPLRWHGGSAVTVVVVSHNYPGTPRTGDVISGGEQPGVIHAGTARRADGALVSAGGRVLSATATGPDLAAARAAAYALVDGIKLEGSHHRTDIALGAVEGRIKL
nr:phosphoribosylamine--glycine ligase [Actinoplanes digitatis]